MVNECAPLSIARPAWIGKTFRRAAHGGCGIQNGKHIVIARKTPVEVTQNDKGDILAASLSDPIRQDMRLLAKALAIAVIGLAHGTL